MYIGVVCQINYNGITTSVSKESVYNYLTNLFTIIDEWEKEYVNSSIIGGNIWNLSINYSNGDKKVYNGKASCPSNFEELEKLNQKVIEEVYNG